jgi:hypothetical protein
VSHPLAPFGGAADFLPVPQGLFLFAKGTFFICIGVFLSADRAAIHCHDRSSHRIIFILYIILFFGLSVKVIFPKFQRFFTKVERPVF